jgi:eukaryotic-like serine/threonine-protein kinase
MRLVRDNPHAVVLEEGVVLDGYTVEGVDDAHAGPEMRYAVTGPGGERATLHLSRRPFADRKERTRFRRLAELRARFTHPAAIEVSDLGEHAGHPYLVTEPHEKARTFGDLLAGEAPLEPRRLVAMLEPVAEALDLAHDQGLVHQGLGGESLLLAGEDRLVLDSFALFELGGESAWTTVQRSDLRYRAPEQVRAEELGASGNVYSLAALIVHGLTGEPPYTGDRLALNYAHLMEAPPRISRRMPGIDPAIDAVIARALAKEPENRPRSASQLLALVSMALDVPASLDAAEPPAEAPRRHAPAENGAGRGHRLRTTGHASEPAFPPSAMSGVTTPTPTAPRATSLRSTLSPAGVAPAAAPRRRTRLRAAAAVALAIAAALSGGALAVALDPLGGDEPRAEAPAAAAAAWNRLDSQRAELRAELAGADTPQEQAEIAGRLVSAYDQAARAAGPGAQAREARAVRDAYALLAASAEAGDETGYAEASQAIAAGEQRLQARR